MYTNVDSLLNKMDELHTKIMENYYDIIAITEVYAKNKDQDDIFISEWKIPGYNLYFSPAKIFTCRGCIIYTKENLKTVQIDDKQNNYVEHVQLGISYGNDQNILITCIYHSPSATNPECIQEIYELITRKSINNIKYCYILTVGDFNFKEINWENNNTSVGI